jgi:hypothetical protein
VKAAADAATADRGVAGVTGWLQFASSQQQQQQRGSIARMSSSSADCASTMLADVSGRATQQGTDGNASTGAHSSGPHAVMQFQQLARCSSDGALDVAGQQMTSVAGKALQPSVAGQQQQPTGSLRRHLFRGWRRPSSSTAVGETETSSALDSPASAAAAAAAGAGFGPRGSLQHSSGASAAAAASAVVSSGGAVAIMHASEVQGSPCGSKRSGGASQQTWAGSGSTSALTREGREQTKAQGEQQVRWVCGISTRPPERSLL